MEALISVESYREHMRLVDKYKSDVENFAPNHNAHNALILHQLYFEGIQVPTPLQPGSVLEAACEASCGGIRGMIEEFGNRVADDNNLWVMAAWDVMQRRVVVDAMRCHEEGPIMRVPFMVLDLYEHAYWMDYGADRFGYYETWTSVLNWEIINRRLIEAQKVAAWA